MLQTRLAAILFISCVASHAQAQIWNEMGDAPEGPIGVVGHQETVGTGSLDSIIGSLDVSAGDHVDTYSIVVTDPALFQVTVNSTNSEALANARLWLWNDVTRGPGLVMANDDSPIAPPGDFSPLLTDPMTWPGTQVNSPGPVFAGGKYLLSISYFENNPVDAMGTPLADLMANLTALHGPAMAGGFSNWQNPAAPNVNGYEMKLTGVTYSVIVPEPASLMILMAALLPVLRFRSRHR